MKKVIFAIFIAVLFLFSFSVKANAHMDSGNPASDNHTAQEEKEGKMVWDRLQSKALLCPDLAEADFMALGEYFMGAMLGSSHAAMNQMMTGMMGEEGEKQIHTVMGKRLSGCDTSAAFPAGGMGFMPMMMNMFGQNTFRGWNMMDSGFAGWGGWGGILFMILWWVLIIAAIVALVKWLVNQFKGGSASKSAIEILMERYAKGEIDKKEFEEKREVVGR